MRHSNILLAVIAAMLLFHLAGCAAASEWNFLLTPAARHTQEKLERRVRIETQEKTFAQWVEFVHDKAGGTTILLAEDSDVVDFETPIAISAGEYSFRELIEQLLVHCHAGFPHVIDAAIDDDGIVLIAPRLKIARSTRQARQYDISDLYEKYHEGLDEVLGLLRLPWIEETDWVFPSPVTHHNNQLVVLASRREHVMILKILASLRSDPISPTVRLHDNDSYTSLNPVTGPAPAEVTDQKLDRLITVNFENLPLNDALTHIQKMIDGPYIECSELARTLIHDPVTLSMSDVPARNVIRTIIKTKKNKDSVPVDVYATSDGRIVISDTGYSAAETYIYDIRDLIGHPKDAEARQARIAWVVGGVMAGTAHIESWMRSGSTRSILRVYCDRLMIYNTPEVHRHVERVLAALRASPNRQGIRLDRDK